MPWEFYNRRRSQPAVTNTTSGQAASSAEFPLPPINTTTMTEDLTHIIERDHGVNHPVPASHSLGGTSGSVKSVTLDPELIVSSTYLPQPQEMPQPRVVASPPDDPVMHLTLRISSLLASQEEPQRAIKNLQDSIVHLLERQSELEARWNHQQEADRLAEVWEDTPNDWQNSSSAYAYTGYQEDPEGQQAASRGQDVIVPGRVSDLAAIWSKRQAECNTQSTGQTLFGGTPLNAATNNLQGQPTGDAGFQGNHAPRADGLPGGSEASNPLTSPRSQGECSKQTVTCTTFLQANNRIFKPQHKQVLHRHG